MPLEGLADFPCPKGSAVTCQVGFWGVGEGPEKSARCTESSWAHRPLWRAGNTSFLQNSPSEHAEPLLAPAKKQSHPSIAFSLKMLF